MGQKMKISTTVPLLQSYTVTNAYAIVTGLYKTCTKSGTYKIKTLFRVAAANASDDTVGYLAVGSNPIQDTLFYKSPAGAGSEIVSVSKDNVYVKKGQVVSVYVKYVVSSGATIEYTGNTATGYLQMTEE